MQQGKNLFKDKSKIIFCSILAFLFSVSCICGYQLQNKGETWSGVGGKILILCASLIPTVLLALLLYFVLYYIERLANTSSKKQINCKSCLLCFFISLAAMMICWFPLFLAYYPCVMSSDFDIQIYQVSMGHEYYTNHHPYFSTLEIEFFYNLRGILGTVRKSMAALGIWHLLALSAAFSFSAATLYRLLKRKWIVVVYVALNIIYPVNPVFGLCTTKDVVFSSAFLFFISLLLTRFWILEEQVVKKYQVILADMGIIFFGFIMCSFRNNAVYALIVTVLIAVFFVSREKKLWMISVLAVIFGLYVVTQIGIENWLGVKGKVKSPEMYSVIIQTMGRAYVNKESTMSAEDKALIEKYIPRTALHNYRPALSDPLKTAVTNETFESSWNNMGMVFSDWIKLGFKYADDYIDAFLDLTRGYWYIYDTSYATVWGNELERHMGVLITNNTSGYYGVPEIWDESKLPKLKLMYEKILSRNDFFNWPILNMAFRLSFYNWIMLFTFGYSICRKKKASVLLFLLPILYVCTLLLGPTANMRYAYPIIVCVPMLISSLHGRISVNEDV